MTTCTPSFECQAAMAMNSTSSSAVHVCRGPCVHRRVIERRQREQRDDEPDGERDERDRGQALDPPVMRALFRRAVAEHAAERTTQAHAAPCSGEGPRKQRGEHRRTRRQRATHSICDWRFSMTRPVSQTRCRMPATR